MRDPKRIERILEELKAFWTNNPDLRLGQVLVNLIESYQCHDGPWQMINLAEVFYIEDDTILNILERENNDTSLGE